MNVVQRSRRSLRVVRTAGSIFAGYRWRAWRSRGLPRDEAERRLAPYHRRCAQRVLETATDLQGLMIKVGQMIGARADIFPDEYIEVLSQLHDTVPPRPFATIRAAVERELGASIEQRFAEFSPAPIAAASLSQVHRARLRDGRDVAVKVQYPEIAEIVDVDLQNIRLLASMAGRILRDFDFTDIVDELSANVPLELDFLNEGRNAEAMAGYFAGRDDIIVPKIYWEHTTRRVLTMEFVDGIKITDFDAIAAAGIDRQEVARLLVETYFRQIFAHGFLHADPHPGNLFVRPGPKLVIVDFGLAKRLPPAFVRGFARVAAAIVAGDGPALASAFRDLGFRTRHADDTVFEVMAEAMVTRMSNNGEFNRDRRLLSDFQDKMMRLFRENPVVRVPGDFLYIGRVMGLLDGMGARLGSEVDLLEVLGAELPAASPEQLPA